MRGAAARVSALFLDGVERAEARIAGGGEDHVGALRDLRERQLFALPGLFQAASVTPT